MKKTQNLKVKDLIKALKALDQNATVLISSDEEGNQFSPVLDFGASKAEDYLDFIYGDYGVSPDEDVVIIYPCH